MTLIRRWPSRSRSRRSAAADVRSGNVDKRDKGRDGKDPDVAPIPGPFWQSVPSVQVDRINVGGNQSGQQSAYFAKALKEPDNTWNVDGVAITDMGATGSTPLYFDFDSFERCRPPRAAPTRASRRGRAAQHGHQSGTNDFKGSGRYFYTPGSMQAVAKVPGEASGYLDQDQPNQLRP